MDKFTVEIFMERSMRQKAFHGPVYEPVQETKKVVHGPVHRLVYEPVHQHFNGEFFHGLRQ